MVQRTFQALPQGYFLRRSSIKRDDYAGVARFSGLVFGGGLVEFRGRVLADLVFVVMVGGPFALRGGLQSGTAGYADEEQDCNYNAH